MADIGDVLGRKFLSTPSARRATTIIRVLKRLESISIHALREEGDKPYKRETKRHINFYPRPPRGGRHIRDSGRIYNIKISIHALREEGDNPPLNFSSGSVKFLSTPSARRATMVVI